MNKCVSQSTITINHSREECCENYILQKELYTSIPPMQNSTIRSQTNQDDIKKYSSNRKADAVITKIIAPFALISSTSFSESSLSVDPALGEP